MVKPLNLNFRVFTVMPDVRKFRDFTVILTLFKLFAQLLMLRYSKFRF